MIRSIKNLFIKFHSKHDKHSNLTPTPTSGPAVSVKVLNVEQNAGHAAVSGSLPPAAGAVLKDPRFPSAADYTACLRFQFAKLKKVNILLRVSTNATRPLLQLG